MNDLNPKHLTMLVNFIKTYAFDNYYKIGKDEMIMKKNWSFYNEFWGLRVLGLLTQLACDKTHVLFRVHEDYEELVKTRVLL